MAWRTLSAWSPLLKLVAEPWFLKPSVSAVPSRLSGEALVLTFIHVTLRMPLSVFRISGQARRIISICPDACGPDWPRCGVWAGVAACSGRAGDCCAWVGACGATGSGRAGGWAGAGT